MTPLVMLDAGPALYDLARAVLGCAVGAIIGGRLGWLFYRRHRRSETARHWSATRAKIVRSRSRKA